MAGHLYWDGTDKKSTRALHYVAGDKINLRCILKPLHGLGHLFAPVPPAGTIIIPNLSHASYHQQYTNGIARGENNVMRNSCMVENGTHLMREG